MSFSAKEEFTARLKSLAHLDLASIAPLPPDVKISSYLGVDGYPHSNSLIDLVIGEYYSIPLYPCPIGLHSPPVFVLQVKPDNIGRLAYRAIKTQFGYVRESLSSHFLSELKYLIGCLQKRRHQHHLLTTLREYMQVLSDYNKRKLAYEEGLRQSDASYQKYSSHLSSGE